MPSYPWLIQNELDTSQTQTKMETMVRLGVPYSEDEIFNAIKDMDAQAEKIAKTYLLIPICLHHLKKKKN